MKKTILIGAAFVNLLYLCGCADDRPAATTTTTTEETTVQRPVAPMAPESTTTTETESTRPAGM